MSDAANHSATETLRDGRTVEIRAQRSHDREGMQAAIARSSSGSLYRRFFAVRREFSEKEADYFLDIDFVNHVALVAVADDAGQPTIVGGGRYVVVQPGQAEVAFAIVDAYQGLGIGSALMRHLATLGREAGLRELIAEVLVSSGWLVDLRFELGLTHTSVKEPVAIRSGWGLPPRPERGRPGASWCPSKAAMAPSYPDYDVQCGSPRVSGAKRASNAVSFLALGGADRELIIDIGEDRDVGVDPSRQAAAKLQHGDLA
jgi:GNAT superfamily N-acetyltransferase